MSLSPRALSTIEADFILAYKRGPAHDSWGRLAERAGLKQENVAKLADICVILSCTDRTPQQNIERWIVERVLAVIRPK